MILFASSMLQGSHATSAAELPVVLVGRGWRQDPDGPRARLSRQAQPAMCKPVPVDGSTRWACTSTRSATRDAACPEI